MHNSRQQAKKEVYEEIDITVYVRTFLMELSKIEGRRVKVNTTTDALRIQKLINDPRYTTWKSVPGFDGVPYWNEQGAVCFPSNLGIDKGFIFYFLCNGCDQRTKYLYVFSELSSPLCRQCCRLPYRQATYKERKARRENGKRPPLPSPKEEERAQRPSSLEEDYEGMPLLRPKDVYPQQSHDP